jgi:6-phosphogluconate dehydrogenase (decarboxylating)
VRVGLVGLGKLGQNICKQLIDNDVEVYSYHTDRPIQDEVYEQGNLTGYVTSLELLRNKIKFDTNIHISVGEKPGVYILTDNSFDELVLHCDPSDVIIDYTDHNYGVDRKTYAEKLGVSYIHGGLYGHKYAILSCQNVLSILSLNGTRRRGTQL